MRPSYLRSLLFGVATAPYIIFSLPQPAAAQFDHQTCFKVKDSRKFAAIVDLDMIQDQFDALGSCKVVGKARLFCVPTAKTVQEFTINKQPASLENVVGPETIPDRICYKVKCPKQNILPGLVSDQFGTGMLEKFKTQLLCTPAVKGLPPSPTTTIPMTSTTVPTCIDLDLDTYGEFCLNGPDCNDTDSSINPAATELCDGIDNDCDVSTADGSQEAWSGMPCDGADADFCSEGAFVCTAGAQTCSDATGDNVEVCDGIDNNCDMQTDENDPNLGAPCSTGQPGICAAGTISCQAGALQCDQSTTATAEICDGLDNDCDGAIDNGFDLSSDPNNCGGCGLVCPIDNICSAGSCQCPGGQVTCGGACTDVSSDVQNCGACANTCPSAPNAAATCSSAACGLTCDAGFENCNGNPGDGCETFLLSDPNNCGACGFVCGGAESCSIGVCVP